MFFKYTKRNNRNKVPVKTLRVLKKWAFYTHLFCATPCLFVGHLDRSEGCDPQFNLALIDFGDTSTMFRKEGF